MQEYENLGNDEIVYEIIEYDKRFVGRSLRENLTAIWYMLSILVSGIILGIFISGVVIITIPLLMIVFTLWCLSIILKIMIVDIPASIINSLKQIIRRK